MYKIVSEGHGVIYIYIYIYNHRQARTPTYSNLHMKQRSNWYQHKCMSVCVIVL